LFSRKTKQTTVREHLQSTPINLTFVVRKVSMQWESYIAHVCSLLTFVRSTPPSLRVFIAFLAWVSALQCSSICEIVCLHLPKCFHFLQCHILWKFNIDFVKIFVSSTWSEAHFHWQSIFLLYSQFHIFKNKEHVLVIFVCFKWAGSVYYVPRFAYWVLTLIAWDHRQVMMEFSRSRGNGRYKRHVPGKHFFGTFSLLLRSCL